jgi:hypothetical protein
MMTLFVQSDTNIVGRSAPGPLAYLIAQSPTPVLKMVKLALTSTCQTGWRARKGWSRSEKPGRPD